MLPQLTQERKMKMAKELYGYYSRNEDDCVVFYDDGSLAA
jgi:hypothetical protein